MEIHLAQNLHEVVTKFQTLRQPGHYLRVPMSVYEYLECILGIEVVSGSYVIPYGAVFEYLDAREHPYHTLRYWVIGNYGLDSLPSYTERQVVGSFLVKDLTTASVENGTIRGISVMSTIIDEMIPANRAYFVPTDTYLQYSGTELHWVSTTGPTFTGEIYGYTATSSVTNDRVPGESQSGERAAPIGSGSNSGNR